MEIVTIRNAGVQTDNLMGVFQLTGKFMISATLDAKHNVQNNIRHCYFYSCFKSGRVE